MKDNNGELLVSLVKSVSSNIALEALTNELKAKHLYEPPPMATMGGGNKDKIIKGIEVAVENVEGNTSKSTSLVVDTSIVRLSEIYSNKKGQANKIFWVCLLGVAFTLLLLVAGLIIVFLDESDVDSKKMGIITASASIIPTFISGTAFLFYDKLNKNLQTIEAEIVKLRKLSVFLSMIDSIPNEDARNKAYGDIIKQMN